MSFFRKFTAIYVTWLIVGGDFSNLFTKLWEKENDTL